MQQSRHHQEASSSSSTICISSEEKMNHDIDKFMLPKDYDRNALMTYWNHRPISVMHRLFNICNEVIPFVFAYTKDFYIMPTFQSVFNKDHDDDIQKEELQIYHAKKLRLALTSLGPAFIKLGQQLSIRPDILPSHVLFELQLLCDQVKPISDDEAKQVLKQEFQGRIRIIGDDYNDDNYNDDENKIYTHENGQATNESIIWIKDFQLLASASLGQVYKATLVHRRHGNASTKQQKQQQKQQQQQQQQEIAIKVQRPEMKDKVSLDLYLLNNYGTFLDIVFDKLTNQIPFHESFINCFAHGSYNELDYIKEASNQNYLKKELAKRGITPDVVYIPNVYHEMSSEKVLTMDWVDGIKLANAHVDVVQKLIPVGVELFLTQLLDIGFFHADPHPGNLYVIQKKEGHDNSSSSKPILCLLDFGLCAEIDIQSRLAMTAAIVHLLNGDYNTLINKDAKALGFLPSDLDISTTDIQPILTKILREGLLESKSNLVDRKRNLMAISNELNQVFFEYPFSVPPFFALITRGLGLLEGIALSGDPDFDIFQASYPYASKRAAEIYGKHSWSWLKKSWRGMRTLNQQGGNSSV
jgi:aarF domain-containing kinase